MTTTLNTTAKKTQAEVKVLAVNTLYQYAEQFFNYERQYFSQYLGQSIFKVDGSVKAKYEHEKQSFKGQLPDGTWVNAHYWFTNRYNCFDIHIKICVNGGSYDVKPSTAFCQYDEMTLEMFKIEDGKLIDSPQDISHLKERFDIDSLKAIAANIEQAKKMYESAADKMPHRFKEVFWIERLTR
jgi:hypothetical protein